MKVLKSINNDDGSLCVDIFQREDGSIGFEEYRRDSEDQKGWFPVGEYADMKFESEDSAMTTAKACVGWLAGI